MKVTIIGGGNIGTLMAAEIASCGYNVCIYTSNPEIWNKEVSIYNSHDEVINTANITMITASLKDAVSFADYIFVTHPAHKLKALADEMLPYADKGLKIGIIPGSGGAEFAFEPLINKGCILFGLQRVHSIARIKEKGKSVYMLGKKDKLYLGSIPITKSEELCDDIKDFLGIPCDALPNYLSVTLTPSNPILHTSRLYSMFKEYKNGIVYDRNFLFYEEWTDDASTELIKCDSELQSLCDAIPLDLSNVISLPIYYESKAAEELTKKIKSIDAFKGLLSPMKESDGGWMPDFNSRYFTADFPYGLKIIKDIAKLYNIETPNINKLWDWYKNTAYIPGDPYFNLDITKEEFEALYTL